MIFTHFSGKPSEVNADCIVVTLDKAGVLSESASELNGSGVLTSCIENQDIKGAVGSSLMIPYVADIEAKRVLLIGSGEGELSSFNANKVVSAIAKSLASVTGTVALDLTALASETLPQTWWAEQVVLALHAAKYKYTLTKAEAKASGDITEVIWMGEDVTAELTVADAKAVGTSYAKELGNLPPNICTPSYLAEQAEAMSSEAGFACKIYDEEELNEMGAGAFYSVSKGSTEPGKIIIMEYKGAGDDAPNHMILGKGITFDSGGISLKPGPKMDEMKYDMCGAASVFGVMKTIALLKPKVNIVAMVTSAENMPAGNASKPGDVVTSLSGQTIEILNTDAEGRLVLCDALTIGIRDYQPETCIDIATLTGACMMALGKVNSGLFTEDDELAGELVAAGKLTGDSVWRLPLQEEYQASLDSNFADIANIGGPLAGATTAACFLSRFTQDTRWAHIDIAGPAWGGDGTSKGATGRPVPLLTTYLLSKA